MIAFFDEEVTGWHGVHQAFQVREFMNEGILMTAVNLAPSLIALSLPAHGRELGELMADYNHMVTAGCLIEDTGTGRVRNLPGLGPQVFYQITDKDAARVLRGVALTAEVMFAAGARRVLLPFDGAPEAHDPAEVRSLLARPVPKRSIELFTVHLMGTARMSDNPGARRRGQLRGVPRHPGTVRRGREPFPRPDRGQPDGDNPRAGHPQRAAADRAARPVRHLNRLSTWKRGRMASVSASYLELASRSKTELAAVFASGSPP